MHFPRQKHRQDNEDERILPLTNVIFLLIIFFMLVGHLARPDALAIQPPRSVSSNPADVSGLVVQINAEGLIAIDGQKVSPRMLKERAQDYLANHPQGKGIRLKADGLVDAARVVAVMQVLRKAGVEQLRLLTRPVKR